MQIQEYQNFVKETDWTTDRDLENRKSIAQYGLASETGSLVSAVKKRLLQQDGANWSTPNSEIIEELGDIIWYTSMVAGLLDKPRSLNEILLYDFTSLRKELEGDQQFKDALREGALQEFLEQSAKFEGNLKNATFKQYQETAILTSRTEGQDLLHVCLTRLFFYSTVMMSKGFPEVEKLLQDDITDLPIERTLAMVMWHVAAIATVYDVSLDEVVKNNQRKLANLFRLDQSDPTPLHDENERVPSTQRFPRKLAVSFVSVGRGRLQMYSNGKRLGDELTDNSLSDDGYRFHDIMHLSNMAILGWSPVLRDLMGRKRKFDPKIDEVQDGARAKIIEEAVVKAIHSEGLRVGNDGKPGPSDPRKVFTSKDQISYRFLKMIRNFVSGLEVENNTFWEWQEAIVRGHDIFRKLQTHKQGTVTVDLEKRSIEFDHRVAPHLRGAVLGTGLGRAELSKDSASLLNTKEIDHAEGHLEIIARTAAQKIAILRSLGLNPPSDEVADMIRVEEFGDSISVCASDEAKTVMWENGVINFQVVDLPIENGVLCYAIALGELGS